MKVYIFDNCSLSIIINSYYVDVQDDFWLRFKDAVNSDIITSVKEVRWELEEKYSDEKEFKIMMQQSEKLFPKLAYNEMLSLKRLMENKRVHDLVKKAKLLAGKPLADPMIIAKAISNSSIIVTEEKYKTNAIKIPNVCEMYGVRCINLREFFVENEWKF